MRAAARLAIICFGSLSLVACIAPDREATDDEMFYDEGVGGDDGTNDDNDDDKHRCDDGDTKKCRIKIGEHEGVVTCVDGLRTCEDGEWSECEGFDS
jgi:hypothetical protein